MPDEQPAGPPAGGERRRSAAGEGDVASPFPVQARWYARLLDRDLESQSLLSTSQLQIIITQLRKVCNHPRILLPRVPGSSNGSRGRGGDGSGGGGLAPAEIPFVDFGERGGGDESSDEDEEAREEERLRRAREAQAELRALSGLALVASSGIARRPGHGRERGAFSDPFRDPFL